jgi:predicted nucleic-acid-binding protein
MTSSVDMSDLLIAQSAHHWGCQSVLTLDKKASKSDLFELL